MQAVKKAVPDRPLLFSFQRLVMVVETVIISRFEDKHTGDLGDDDKGGADSQHADNTNRISEKKIKPEFHSIFPLKILTGCAKVHGEC